MYIVIISISIKSFAKINKVIIICMLYDKWSILNLYCFLWNNKKIKHSIK